MSNLDLAIVIPSLNRHSVLLNSLIALRSLDLYIPIIVVDQTPNDEGGINEQLKNYCDDHDIDYVHLNRPSVVAAMNIGLSKSSASHVLFLDDDIRPDSELILSHLDLINTYECTLVAGRVIQPWDNQKGVADNSEDNFSFNGLKQCEAKFFMGGNFVVDRDFALSIGGFDENFIGTAHNYEKEFSERTIASGYKIIYNGAAAVHHLKEAEGGIRSYGQFLKSIKPHQSVSAYYYILQSKNQNRIVAILRRLRQRLANRTQLRQPWWIPLAAIGELRGLLWAIKLNHNGPKLINPSSY